MATLREWLRRLRGTLRKNPCDREMEEELRSHLELAGDDMLRSGGSTEDALRAARLRVGGAVQAMEAMRDQRGLPWLDDLTHDVRDGVRSIRRSPVFTAVALLTLALGIGANTAIFSIVNGVVLQPLRYPKPEQLMYLTTQYPGVAGFRVSGPEYFEFREMNRSFSAVGAFTEGESDLIGDERPRRVRAAVVDAGLLDALKIKPAQGRFFTPEETRVTGNETLTTVILSHELWQAALGGRSIVGQTVKVDGVQREVIGVMPPGAALMDHRTEIWLPLRLNPANRQDRGSHSFFLIGRLRDGETTPSAQKELDALIKNWGKRTNAKGHVFSPLTENGGHILQMKPLQEQVLGDAGRAIWVLQAAVGLVLLIACANLANLLLARAETRHHEFAVRKALGASYGRLVRQFMTEGVLLSIAGGTLGVVLARIGVGALIAAYPTSLPRSADVSIDATVLFFTLAISMATGMLFGLAPMYFFAEQSEQAGPLSMPSAMNVVLRTTLPARALAHTLEDVIREVDPTVAIVRLREMDEVFAESIIRPLLLAQLVGAFGVLALLLAAIGTYGVLAYTVEQRRREIGIRLALGANRLAVLAKVMKQGLLLTAIGIVIGLGGALGLTRLMKSLLFGVEPTDVTTLASVAATIALVAAVACWLPAWRASRVDPSIMLRHE